MRSRANYLGGDDFVVRVCGGTSVARPEWEVARPLLPLALSKPAVAELSGQFDLFYVQYVVLFVERSSHDYIFAFIFLGKFLVVQSERRAPRRIFEHELSVVPLGNLSGE